ncbi:unnamed protein product, partial [Mesorhabditis belari]|uniref:Ig-like domain-containing protein n=1 Tax=Mesorhabditis belari TaxID=2138241 RepID=A0AAF3J1P5_9BILA
MLIEIFLFISIFAISFGNDELEDHSDALDSVGSPQIIRHSHFDQHFRLGLKLIVMCEAEGLPRPQLRWYKNGAELSPESHIQLSEKHISLVRIRSRVEIDPTTLSDRGTYSCLATNPHGSDLKSIRANIDF